MDPGTIARGARTIADSARYYYGFWQNGLYADAEATARQIVEDCKTLTRQAEELLADTTRIKNELVQEVRPQA